MGSVYARGNIWWIRYRGPDGLWTQDSTHLQLAERSRADRMLARIEQQIRSGVLPKELGPATLSSFFSVWLEQRKQLVRTWKNDDDVMRLHVLPVIGKKQLDEVRAIDLVRLVSEWRARAGADRMAPKSIYNAYSTVSALFRDALLEGLITASPCMLTRHQLGPRGDKNPEWRQTAIYTQAELEQLISDTRIPLDRRVVYGLMGVAAMRGGEVSGLHWRNVDAEQMKPLGMLYVAFSYEKPTPKGDVPRPVPIHPTLAGILAEWKLSGWAAMFGRKPTGDDLVVPLPPESPSTSPGRIRRKAYHYDRLQEDLVQLGLRRRRVHDLRRTMISLARSNGAVKEILRRATHKPPTEVIEGYTSFEWPVVCREVLKLPLRRRGDELIELPIATAVNAEPFATPLATAKVNPAMTAAVLSGLPRTRTEQSQSQTVPGEHPSHSQIATFATGLGAVESPSDVAHCSNVANQLRELADLAERGSDIALDLERLLTRLRARAPVHPQHPLEES